MKYSENALNILAAKTYKGIGKAWIVKNLGHNETVSTIVALLNKNSKSNEEITIEDFEQTKEKISRVIEASVNYLDGVIALGDEHFPKCRGTVKNCEQPIFLFYRGNLKLLQLTNKNVAVIGLLNPDIDTEIFEKEVVDELVKNDLTIVSGLALGCDSIAHRQALDSNGKTIAILPSPLNNILPTINRNLAEEIVENNGLLITEYLTDAKSKMELTSRYQERDRLQALFSDAIILAASYAKNDLGNDSGSRLAMEYALNYSIPRAVLYDSDIDIHNPKYDLSRQLIKEEQLINIIGRKNYQANIKKLFSPSNCTQVCMEYNFDNELPPKRTYNKKI